MKEFDDLVNNSFEAERDIPFSEEAWEELSEKLDTLPSHSNNNWWWLLLLLPLLASLIWCWSLQKEVKDLKQQLLSQANTLRHAKASIIDTIIIHHYDTLIQTIIQEKLIKEFIPDQQILANLKTVSPKSIAVPEQQALIESSKSEIAQIVPLVHHPFASSLPINILHFNPSISPLKEPLTSSSRYMDYMELSILNVDLEQLPYFDSLSYLGNTEAYAVDLGLGWAYKNWQLRTSLGYESISFKTIEFEPFSDSTGQVFALERGEIDQQSLRWRIGLKYMQPLIKRLYIAGSADVIGYFNQRMETQYHYASLSPYIDPYEETVLEKNPSLYFDRLLLQIELNYNFHKNWHLAAGWGKTSYLQERAALKFKSAYHIGLQTFF